MQALVSTFASSMRVLSMFNADTRRRMSVFHASVNASSPRGKKCIGKESGRQSGETQKVSVLDHL